MNGGTKIAAYASNMKLLRYFSAGCIVLAATPASFSASTTYHSRAAFEAVLSGATNVDFEGAWPNHWTDFSNTGIALDGIDFQGPTSYGFPYLYIGESSVNPYGVAHGLTTGDFLLGEGRGEISMTSIAPGGFFAVGFDFSLAEAGFVGDEGVLISTSNGDQAAFSVALGQKHFFGIVSDSPFTTLVFENATGERPPQLIIDNVTYTTADVSVPELPNSLFCLALAAAPLALLRRLAK